MVRALKIIVKRKWGLPPGGYYWDFYPGAQPHVKSLVLLWNKTRYIRLPVPLRYIRLPVALKQLIKTLNPFHFDDLVQDCSISIANALEIL